LLQIKYLFLIRFFEINKIKFSLSEEEEEKAKQNWLQLLAQQQQHNLPFLLNFSFFFQDSFHLTFFLTFRINNAANTTTTTSIYNI